MSYIIDTHKEKFDQAIDRLRSELSGMRVGRANAMLIEDILVDAYGSKTELKQMASISVPTARTLIVQPWDKSVVPDVEKAIVSANIGLTPVNEGNQLRLTVPQLTEESRKELTKAISEKEEKARISIRQIRDKIKDEIQSKEKEKEITEDDKYDLIKKLDELVKGYNTQVKEIGQRKVEEIMTL